jgi:hypothetical protein
LIYLQAASRGLKKIALCNADGAGNFQNASISQYLRHGIPIAKTAQTVEHKTERKGLKGIL